MYYVTMQITFLTRKFRNGQRNLHCDVVHITTKGVSSLTVDCNGVFAIKAYRVKEGTEDGDTVLDDLTQYGEQLIVKTCVNLEAQNTIQTKKVDTKTLDKDTNEAKQHAKYQGRKHRRTQLTP